MDEGLEEPGLGTRLQVWDLPHDAGRSRSRGLGAGRGARPTDEACLTGAAR